MSTQQDIITKAQVLIEALPYIQKFKNTVFVVKYGGSFMDDPKKEISERVVKDISFLAAVGIKVVVVHGGGKAITRNLQKANISTNFNQGHRITDAASIKIAEKTLNQEINLDICQRLQSQGGKPISIIGNKIFQSRKMSTDLHGEPIDVGYVGEITQVNHRPVIRALEQGYTPIVSPIGVDVSGHTYNNNADAAAAWLASSIHARRLVYLSDVPGLLSDPSDPKSLISTLGVERVPELITKGVIASGMLPKVNSSVVAITNGVHRVHFVDGRVPHSILLEIFTDQGIGTEIVNSII